LSDNIKFPIEGLGLGPDSLFIRSYYPKLLSKIRSFQRVCLIGNPGTQKSMFQFYYLTMIFNDKFGALPPDYLNNSQKPKVVLQQVGENDMYVFFVEEMIVHYISIFKINI
jgi:hypothetical protein